jgi:hypothetical protein
MPMNMRQGILQHASIHLWQISIGLNCANLAAGRQKEKDFGLEVNGAC